MNVNQCINHQERETKTAINVLNMSYAEEAEESWQKALEPTRAVCYLPQCK